MKLKDMPVMPDSELESDDSKRSFLLILPDAYTDDDLEFYRLFLYVNDVRLELCGTFCEQQLDGLTEAMRDSGLGVFMYSVDEHSDICVACGKELNNGKCNYEFCPEKNNG